MPAGAQLSPGSLIPPPPGVESSNSQNSTAYLSGRFVTDLDILLPSVFGPIFDPDTKLPSLGGWSHCVLETWLGRPGTGRLTPSLAGSVPADLRINGGHRGVHWPAGHKTVAENVYFVSLS